MPKSRYTEKQIVMALQEVDSGSVKVDELCRRMAIGRRTFYHWRAKYGGLEVNQAAKLRQLEDENRRLKHAVAELTLDNRALREVVRKKF